MVKTEGFLAYRMPLGAIRKPTGAFKLVPRYPPTGVRLKVLLGPLPSHYLRAFMIGNFALTDI